MTGDGVFFAPAPEVCFPTEVFPFCTGWTVCAGFTAA
jgi:hypothetical protein